MAEPAITSLRDLETVAAEWNDLLRDTEWRSVYATHEFVVHWYRCFAPSSVRVLRVRDGKDTIGFMPLVRERRSAGLRVLRGLSNLHCMHTVPAVRRGAAARFPRALADTLRADRSWDVLECEFAYSFTPWPRLIDVAAVESAGIRVREHIDDTYSVQLPPTFDEYCAQSLSANARKNYHRWRNKLARAGATRTRVLHGDDAVAEWPALVRIEDAGWKGEAGSSLKRLDDAYRRYYEGLLPMLAKRGELSLYFLDLNDAPIAGVFGYREGDVFHWFKTGYDEAYGEFSPSNLLLLAIIEDLIGRPEIHRMHLFPIDFGYKHRYANEPATSRRLTAYHTTLGGRLAYAKLSARERLKNVTWLRKLIRRGRGAGPPAAD